MDTWTSSVIIIFITYIVSLLLTFVLTVSLIVGAQRKVSSLVTFNVIVFFWLFADFSAQFLVTSDSKQVLLARVANLVSAFIIPALFWIVIDVIPKIRIRPLWILALATVFLGALSSLPSTELQLDISKEGIAVVYAPWVYSLFLLVTFSSVLMLELRVWLFERKSTIRRSKAITSLLIALTIMLSLNLFGALVIAQYKWSQILAPLSMVITAQILAISIFRQHLIYTRQFVARAVAYLTLYAATVGISVLISVVVLNHTVLSHNRLSLVQIVSYSVLALLLVVIQPYLKKFFDKTTDWLFFREEYDPERLLEKLNDRLLRQVEILEVSHTLVTYLKNELKLDQVAVALSDGKLITSNPRHISALNSVNVETNKFQFDIMTVQAASSRAKTRFLAKLMQEADVAVVSRMKDKETYIGNIFYSSKLSGDSFSTHDLQLIQLIADQVMLIIANALKFEEIASFNARLQEEVARATERLRHANKRLKVLDKLKDDFISVASHQFRTPAGSIRQAFKMSHDPNMSKKDREEVLRLAEANSEQLSSLVNTMLDISRIEAGRFTITRSPADIAALVDKVTMATDIVAEQKNIKLNFKRPEQTILLNVDRGKIGEAMKNYVENAIKYSPDSSTVTITLLKKDDTVYFEVTDAGMGVPEKDRHSLFGKYYRAENAREFQPDGNGIGLYVVKNIIEGHGGTVYYRPLTQGSLFGFSVPVDTH